MTNLGYYLIKKINNYMPTCRLCGDVNTHLAFKFEEQPIVHHLLKDNNKKNYFKSSFNIFECSQCGFLFSKDYFLPKEELYENYITLSSAKPQPHQDAIISKIKDFSSNPDTNNKILEIGCNDGTFLENLLSKNYSNIQGIEPTKDAFKVCKDKGLNVINKFFTRALVEELSIHEKFNTIITRQVLEHISDLNDFCKALNMSLKSNGLLIIEIPDHSMNYELADYSFWEEHINYFTINTLRQLLYKNGFEIIHYESVLFTGKALIAYCRKLPNEENINFFDYDLVYRRKYIDTFEIFREKVHTFLKEESKKSDEIIVFGAGCRGCNMVNMLKISSYINFFIDDSADKVGKFCPGSHKAIRSSSNLNANHLILLATNAESEEGVIRRFNLSHEKTFSILPPSSRLPTFWKKHISYLQSIKLT